VFVIKNRKKYLSERLKKTNKAKHNQMGNILKEKLTYSTMNGTPSNCILAQVFGSDGMAITSIRSIYKKRKATQYAKLFAASPDLYEALAELVENIDNWIATGKPTDAETLIRLYDNAKKALSKAK